MRVPNAAASAPTEFRFRLEAYSRRTIWEPLSPALSRESALSRLLSCADSPPALTVLKASRKPLVKICAWLTLYAPSK